MSIQAITPFLWFDSQAEEAANFYVSIFPNSKVGKAVRYGKAGPGPAGSVITVEFQLQGMTFVALNGGPRYKFTEAVSFVITCEDQQEIDFYWSQLSDGGSESQCGWLKDKFGLSWQVVPSTLPSLLGNPDPEKSARAMKALLGMKKLIIEDLKRASDG